MKTIIKLAPLVAVVGLLSACGTTMEQRAATGGIGGSFTEIIGESARLSVSQSADAKQLWLRVSDLATTIIVK